MPPPELATLLPKMAAAGHGETVVAFGQPIRILLRGEDTGGSFCAMFSILDPEISQPPHIQHREDEYFLVMDGQIRFEIGDRTETCGGGTLIFVPRHTRHAYKNVGNTRARLMMWDIPAGHESYIRELSKVEVFTEEAIQQVHEKYGVEWLK